MLWCWSFIANYWLLLLLLAPVESVLRSKPQNHSSARAQLGKKLDSSPSKLHQKSDIFQYFSVVLLAWIAVDSLKYMYTSGAHFTNDYVHYNSNLTEILICSHRNCKKMITSKFSHLMQQPWDCSDNQELICSKSSFPSNFSYERKEFNETALCQILLSYGYIISIPVKTCNCNDDGDMTMKTLSVNTLRPEENGYHFTDILKCIFFHRHFEMYFLSISIGSSNGLLLPGTKLLPESV